MAKPKSDMLRVRKHRSVAETAVKYERAAEFAREVAGALASGDTVHALLSGNFIFGDFLEALAVENGVIYEDLTLSTLAVSDENVVSLSNLLKHGYVKRLQLLVSSYFWAHNRANAKFMYEQLCDDFDAVIAVAGIHTKIALIRTEKSKVVIQGSANMRSSRTIEAVTVESNPELYDFHMRWHQKIFDDYAVTRKERRASNLYSFLSEDRAAHE